MQPPLAPRWAPAHSPEANAHGAHPVARKPPPFKTRRGLATLGLALAAAPELAAPRWALAGLDDYNTTAEPIETVELVMGAGDSQLEFSPSTLSFTAGRCALTTHPSGFDRGTAPPPQDLLTRAAHGLASMACGRSPESSSSTVGFPRGGRVSRPPQRMHPAAKSAR